MADPRNTDPHRPSHPGNFPDSTRTSRNTTGRKFGFAIGALVLVALLWWLFAGTNQHPGQEQTLGEPAGFGTAAAPEAAGEDGAVARDPAAEPDDPQAAIGADPFTEPSSPAAAEQATPGTDVAEDGEPAPAGATAPQN